MPSSTSDTSCVSILCSPPPPPPPAPLLLVAMGSGSRRQPPSEDVFSDMAGADVVDKAFARAQLEQHAAAVEGALRGDGELIEGMFGAAGMEDQGADEEEVIAWTWSGGMPKEPKQDGG